MAYTTVFTVSLHDTFDERENQIEIKPTPEFDRGQAMTLRIGELSVFTSRARLRELRDKISAALEAADAADAERQAPEKEVAVAIPTV